MSQSVLNQDVIINRHREVVTVIYISLIVAILRHMEVQLIVVNPQEVLLRLRQKVQRAIITVVNQA